MEEFSLSHETRDFIQTFIPSLVALEVLLLLLKNPEETWTLYSITARLRTNPTMINDFLLFYASKGVLINDGQSFRLNQDQKEFHLRLNELSVLFEERPVSVLNEIYRVPNRPGVKIQLFADAFKIKKEK